MSPYNCNKLYCEKWMFLSGGKKIKAINPENISLIGDFSVEEFEIFRFFWDISYKDGLSLHHL